MRVGDQADSMFIIIKGEVGIYTDHHATNCIVTLGDPKVFGEKALENDEPRYLLNYELFFRIATIKALTDLLCFELNKNDYHQAVYYVKMIQKS